VKRNLQIAHDKVKEFDWTPTYYRRTGPPATKYQIPRRTKDPFRHLMRDYFAMEEDKDNRQYGALENPVARPGGATHAQHRWMEVMKPMLSVTLYGESSAAKAMASFIDAVDNPELRQGYLAQMLDEVRHTNQQAYLIRYLTKHAPDPAGFHCSLTARDINPLTRAGRLALCDTFLNEDPIRSLLALQVVGETAYTNPIFVAATEIAAANNDTTTASVFLSTQSDEVRHMANGYATLAAVAGEPANYPMLQNDFDYAFWRMHTFFDNFLGFVYDYFPKVRLKSYREYWERWLWEDWFGSYVERLEPFGLMSPRFGDQALEDVRWGGHTTAMFAAGIWPVHFWRQDVLEPEDFVYLEEHYPGWDSYFGDFWRAHAQASDPANGTLLMDSWKEHQAPPLCRVCHMPASLPRPDLSPPRLFRDLEGRKHAFCSQPCEMEYRGSGWRYRALTWWEIYDGTDLAEYVERAGLLRADGRTLIAQPHLRTDARWLWTIDDLRRAAVEIRDPLREVPAADLPLIA
jgi:methane monooxygenase component A alpha chain